MKKALREMQTLCAGCSKAERKILPRCSPPLDTESVLAVVRQSQNFRAPQTPSRWCKTAKI